MTTVDDADSRTFEAVVLLYVASSKLPDGDLAEAEAIRILELTRAHTDRLAPHYGAQVVHDASAALAAAPDVDARLSMVVEAAELVGAELSLLAKRALIDELTSITAADGSPSTQERDFVAAVAKTFGLEPG